MTRYAAETTVSVEASRIEMERTLMRYGAEKFAYATEPGRATVGFEMEGRRIRLDVPLPKLEEFRLTPGKKLERTRDQMMTEWEKACRQRWRAVALVVKAKLEAVESGISTVESEFMSGIILPVVGTVGVWMRPQIKKAYELGTVPQLLPMLEAHNVVED
jgi:hypothetical protein